MLRLIATLEGEVVRDIKPIIGYVHTGIEKTAEQKSYWKVIPVIERMDYLSYYFNAMAFCGAVDLLGVEVPTRAQYLRVIHLELDRDIFPIWCGWARARWTSARSRCSNTWRCFLYVVYSFSYIMLTVLPIYEDEGAELLHFGVSARTVSLNGGVVRYCIRGPERPGLRPNGLCMPTRASSMRTANRMSISSSSPCGDR